MCEIDKLSHLFITLRKRKDTVKITRRSLLRGKGIGVSRGGGGSGGPDPPFSWTPPPFHL